LKPLLLHENDNDQPILIQSSKKRLEDLNKKRQTLKATPDKLINIDIPASA